MSWSAGAELVARWWGGELGGAGKLLMLATAPLEWAFRGVSAARRAAYDGGFLRTHHAGVPVISVGNLSVGGSGKTPVAAWLVAELQRRGRRPALLHGGYAPDEPELHRRWAPGVPVVAERDRVVGAALAVAAGADVLVLDDGFQHRRIARDLDLLLVAAESGAERIRLLPRGPWREDLTAARRASLIAITSRTADAAQVARLEGELNTAAPHVPRVRLRLDPAGWLHEGRPADSPPAAGLVVAGVGNPQAFVENARAAGARIAGQQLWRDHHDYSAADAAVILAKAGTGPVLTTAKDWVKLERLLPGERVWVLRQEVRVESGARELAAALTRALES